MMELKASVIVFAFVFGLLLAEPSSICCSKFSDTYRECIEGCRLIDFFLDSRIKEITVKILTTRTIRIRVHTGTIYKLFVDSEWQFFNLCNSRIKKIVWQGNVQTCGKTTTTKMMTTPTTRSRTTTRSKGTTCTSSTVTIITPTVTMPLTTLQPFTMSTFSTTTSDTSTSEDTTLWPYVLTICILGIIIVIIGVVVYFGGHRVSSERDQRVPARLNQDFATYGSTEELEMTVTSDIALVPPAASDPPTEDIHTSEYVADHSPVAWHTRSKTK